MKLVSVGFGNLISAGKIVSIVSPDSAPIKRMIQEVREKGLLIDASFGRSTKAVIVMDSSNVVLSALPPETIAYICNHCPIPVYADPVSTVKAMKLQPVLHHLAAIKPNALEAQCLTGESDPERAALALVERGVRRVFISLGAQGMIAADEKQLLRLPVLPTRVINATGAGDAATAAIVLAGIRGMGLEETALLAQKAGAVTCCSESANAPELAGILTQIHFDG